MPTLLDLNSRSFQSQVERSSFSDLVLKVDSSVGTIIKIFSSLQKGLPLCLLPQHFPEAKLEELRSTRFEEGSLYFTTSGTTGQPKIVKLTKESLLYSALHNHPDWQLGPESRYALSLPLHHIAGVMILLRCYVHGASLLLDDFATATHLSLVPTQLMRPLPVKSAKILLGGGPIPFALCQRATPGLSLFPSYGMTEMCGQITVHHFSPSDTELTLGHPLPGRELKVENGEIFVRSKTLCTDWLATKDLGYYDAKGLRVLGRKDRMFISGGENIHPEEIEKALVQYPGIYAALVKGVEDPEWGKKCVAYYAAEKAIDSLALKEFLLSSLPPYKIPKEFNFSLTSAGKGMVALDARSMAT